MKTRKVSINVLKVPAAPRAASPRELRRIELEGKLEEAIRAAGSDSASAFKLTLDDGEKLPGVRVAFNRVRARVRMSQVNLHKRGDDLYIAAVPQTRGRRPKGSS